MIFQRVWAKLVLTLARTLTQTMTLDWYDNEKRRRTNETENQVLKRFSRMGQDGRIRCLAERQGFEPWVRFHAHTLSKRAP